MLYLLLSFPMLICSKPTLLNKAMTLYAGNRFMKSCIQFTKESFPVIMGSLKSSPIPAPDSRTVSSLLNRQLKATVSEIINRVTGELFDDLQKELQKELHHKTRSLWATSFCVIVILCICIEEIQSAAQGVVLHSRENPSKDELDEEVAILVCRELDNFPFAHICELFHAIYKSQKIQDQNTGRGKRKRKSDTAGFNPLRGEMIESDESDGLDRETIEFIRDIRVIIKDLSGSLFPRVDISTKDVLRDYRLRDTGGIRDARLSRISQCPKLPRIHAKEFWKIGRYIFKVFLILYMDLEPWIWSNV